MEELKGKKNKVKLIKPSILMVFRVPTHVNAKKGYGNLNKPH
jgi:hypothetical protein